jgi:hypothetical protein
VLEAYDNAFADLRAAPDVLKSRARRARGVTLRPRPLCARLPCVYRTEARTGVQQSPRAKTQTRHERRQRPAGHRSRIRSPTTHHREEDDKRMHIVDPWRARDRSCACACALLTHVRATPVRRPSPLDLAIAASEAETRALPSLCSRSPGSCPGSCPEPSQLLLVYTPLVSSSLRTLIPELLPLARGIRTHH